MRRGRFRPSIISWTDYLRQDGLPYCPDLTFLAEGDSWFTVSGFPAYNLLFELRFNKSAVIVNCGMPGDTIKHMAQIEKNRSLREALSAGARCWDGILLSGGGNDLIEEIDDIVLPKNRRPSVVSDPSQYCDQARLNNLVVEVQRSFRNIAALRDREGGPGKGVPIFVHTYDYVAPRNAPATFIFGALGPWLFPVLRDREIPGSDWMPLSNYLIGILAEGIVELETGDNPISDFYAVDTRNTLKPAELGQSGDSQDWQNEIHPNGGGYEKLAKKMEAVFASKLGNW